jgi:hypothetical protein
MLKALSSFSLNKIRNQQVSGSSPLAGLKFNKLARHKSRAFFMCRDFWELANWSLDRTPWRLNA